MKKNNEEKLCPTCKNKLYKVKRFYWPICRGRKIKTKTVYRCIFCEKLIAFSEEYRREEWKPK